MARNPIYLDDEDRIAIQALKDHFNLITNKSAVQKALEIAVQHLKTPANKETVKEDN